MYAVLDELEGGVTVAQYPTAIKALNAARRIEPRPEGKPLGYRSAVDGSTRDWRYTIKRRRDASFFYCTG